MKIRAEKTRGPVGRSVRRSFSRVQSTFFSGAPPGAGPRRIPGRSSDRLSRLGGTSFEPGESGRFSWHPSPSAATATRLGRIFSLISESWPGHCAAPLNEPFDRRRLCRAPPPS
jgi:hypothetical protein